MSASTKLSTAVQALCLLDTSDSALSSDRISRATGIHPSRIRGILSKLRSGGMVRSVRGLEGGYMLTSTPRHIHLQEIYCAVELKKAFHLDITRTGGTQQNTSAAVNDWFLKLFSELQVQIEDTMRDITLEDILAQIQHNTSPSSST